MTPALPPPAPAPEVIERALTPQDTARLSAAVTDADVRIDAGFAGARIILYGAVFTPEDTPADIVVIVRGPDEPVRLVRKVQVAGLWLNSRPVLFEGAPGYYMAASTRPLSDIANFGTLRRLGVGVDHLRINAPEERRVATRYGVRDVVVSRLGTDYLDWRRAVVRLREAAGLYDTDARGVRFVDDGLFRAEIQLPAEAPVGVYETEVWLFQEGEAVSVRRGEITVRKVGFERLIYDFAYGYSWLYGLACVALALVTGWAASSLFRRN